jgi:hypothetical protein
LVARDWQAIGNAASGRTRANRPGRIVGGHADRLRPRYREHAFTLRGALKAPASKHTLDVSWCALWTFGVGVRPRREVIVRNTPLIARARDHCLIARRWPHWDTYQGRLARSIAPRL